MDSEQAIRDCNRDPRGVAIRIARWCHPRAEAFSDDALVAWCNARFSAPEYVPGYERVATDNDLEHAIIVSLYDLLGRFAETDVTPTVVVDAGAHIGALSMAALKRGAQKVIAVEPSAANAARLRENLRSVAGEERWLVIEAAIDDGSAAKVSLCSAYNSGQRSMVYEYDHGVNNLVLATSMESVLDAAGDQIDYLKVDIEGAEWIALRPRPGLEERLRRVKFVDMECHCAFEGGGYNYPPKDLEREVREWLGGIGWPKTRMGDGHLSGRVAS